MRGYCESCAREVQSELDQYTGANECPDCGDDVHPGVHVEGEYEDVNGTDEEFDEWLLQE